MDGEGSLAYKIIVIGDTVGGILKNPAGLTLDILVYLLATVSLVFTLLF